MVADLGQLRNLAELCCVLDNAGSQHYPPSWVEAQTRWAKWLLGRPLQWELRSRAFVGAGAEPCCSAPADTSCDGRKGRGGLLGCNVPRR